MIISIFITFLPKIIKTTVAQFVLDIYDTAIPSILEVFVALYEAFFPIYSYAFMYRVGRSILPYFIRWHWNFLFLLDYVERPYVQASRRSFIYRRLILKNRCIKNIEFKKNANLFQALGIVTRFASILHISLLYWGLFSAVSGEYFNCLIMTSNTEYIAGNKRPDDPYTLGETPWQDKHELRHSASYSNIIGYIMKQYRVFVAPDYPTLRRIINLIKDLIDQTIKTTCTVYIYIIEVWENYFYDLFDGDIYEYYDIICWKIRKFFKDLKKKINL
nr:truncated hypothetical protein Ycf90 [Nitzschia sp. PL3-2]